jgi:hypothetical protein
MSNIVIFGKINPVIQIAEQTSLFNPTPSFKTGEYMTAVANPYILGTNEVDFRVIYGNCVFNDLGEVVQFVSIYTDQVTLSGDVISTWGVDDSVILNAIALKQGTSVVQIVLGNIANNGIFF